MIRVPAALFTAALLLSPGAGSGQEAQSLKAAPRLSQAGQGNATVLWTDLSSPLGGKENFAQAAAALGSRVFVAGGSQTDDKCFGAVVAYDAKTGEVKWSEKLDLGGDIYNFLSSVAVSGSTVYVAGSAVIDGKECLYVKAYDASGQEKWLLLEDIPGLLGLSCGVVALGSKVVAYANNADYGCIYGLNPKTGAVKWSAPFPPGKWIISLVLSGSALYASGLNSAMGPPGWVIRSYSAQTGAFRWETPVDNLVYLENIAAAGAIVAAAGFASGVGGHNEGVLRTFAAKSGLPGWTANFVPEGTSAYHQVIIKGSRVFASAYGLLQEGRNAAFALAYNAKNGALLWSQFYDIGSPDGCTPRALTVTKQGVYLAGTGKDKSGADAWFVMAANPLSGEAMWDDPTMGRDCVPWAIAGTTGSIIAAGEGTDASLNSQWVVRAYAPK